MSFNLAWTSPINPSGEKPLTIKQIWAGLQRKIRYAQEFVPVIESCEVLSDENGIVKRVVKFAEGKGPKPQATETVTGFEHCWVDFEQEDGTHVRNIVSESDQGLMMTYTFEILSKKEGAELEEQIKMVKGNAKMAVNYTIKVIREMVSDGRIAED